MSTLSVLAGVASRACKQLHAQSCRNLPGVRGAVAPASGVRLWQQQPSRHARAFSTQTMCCQDETMGYSTTKIMVSIKNEPGSLNNALSVLSDHGVNLSSIRSRVAKHTAGALSIYLDVCGSTDSPNVKAALSDLKKGCVYVNLIGTYHVPWFPHALKDFDGNANQVFSYGSELDADHPGFSDEGYRLRRREVAENATKFKHGDEIPQVRYTDEEHRTWNEVWTMLTELHPTNACTEFQESFPLLIENAGYSPDRIPQLQQVSQFLKERTGFQLRPVTGLLSPRAFLNGLAFRVFHSTQYIRHHSRPLYTPEPDVVHELMGHVPMLADPSFAELSQEIGLASLGASDKAIELLSTVYWFTSEFGVCSQNGELRAYGAGLLSSPGELKYCLTNEPQHRDFHMPSIAAQEYPITTFQPVYFVAPSFQSAAQHIREFSRNSLERPFGVKYNPYSQSCDIEELCV